jgi:hypothetical protein
MLYRITRLFNENLTISLTGGYRYVNYADYIHSCITGRNSPNKCASNGTSRCFTKSFTNSYTEMKIFSYTFAFKQFNRWFTQLLSA